VLAYHAEICGEQDVFRSGEKCLTEICVEQTSLGQEKNVYVFANILEKQIGKNNRKNFEKNLIKIFTLGYTGQGSDFNSVSVIKFVSDLWQVGGFLQVIWFPPPIKLTATI
jgi:hypothetical protein